MLFVLLPKSLTLSWISWYIIRKCYHSNAMMLLLRFSTSTKGQGCFQIRQKCDDLSLESLASRYCKVSFKPHERKFNSGLLLLLLENSDNFLPRWNIFSKNAHTLYILSKPLFKCIDRIQKRIENSVGPCRKALLNTILKVLTPSQCTKVTSK